MMPPGVVIHGLDQARLALAMQSPLTLVSGPDAASYAGIAWWRALMRLIGDEHGPMPDVLDCGANPAQAVEALRAGCRTLVLAPGPAWVDVADRARRMGALLLGARPPAFDLAQLRPRDARYHLAAWLRSANAPANARPISEGNGT